MTTLRDAILGTLRQQGGSKMVALLGDHAGDIVVTQGDNYVYARLPNGQVVKAWNEKVAIIRDTPILIGFDSSKPGILQVLDYWQVYPTPMARGIQPHHTSHEFPMEDTVFVQYDQILPLLLWPSDGLVCQLFGANIQLDDGSIFTVLTQDIDFTTNLPANGTRYVLVQINNTTGAVSKVNGSIVDDPALLSVADIPTADTACFGIAAVRCSSGQIFFTRNPNSSDIIDLRFQPSSGMSKSVYDTDGDGIVDNAEALVGFPIKPGMNPDDLQALRWNEAQGYWENGAAVPDFVTEDLSSQVNGITDHFDIAVEATAIDVYVNGLLEYSPNVALDCDGLGFTLAYVPPSGTKIEVHINKPDNATLVTISPLTVEETDADPSVDNVVKIKFPADSLTDEGSGVVSVVFPIINEAPHVIPTAAGFAVTRSGNGGNGTITDIAQGWGVRVASKIPAGNSNSLTYAVDAVTVGTNGWQATARLRRHFPEVQWGPMGMIMRDNAGGKSVCYAQAKDSIEGFNRYQFSADDTWNAVASMGSISHRTDWWMRIKDDKTNWLVYISSDGYYFVQIHQETRNTYLGTVPTHVGLFINPNYNGGSSNPNRTGVDVGMDCLSWQFEQL